MIGRVAGGSEAEFRKSVVIFDESDFFQLDFSHFDESDAKIGVFSRNLRNFAGIWCKALSSIFDPGEPSGANFRFNVEVWK